MAQARSLLSRPLLPLLALALPLAIGACDAKPKPGAEAEPATVEAPAEASPAAPAAPAAPLVTKNACSDAALTLSPDEVIATVRGESIKASELGDQLKNAEREALRTYCQGIAQVRQQALDQTVDRLVLEAAAKEAGMDVESFLKSKVEGKGDPSDEEALAYYEAHKSPTAPPFEAVKDQVLAAMVDETTGKILEELVRNLRAEASVEVKLPDVRPPPLDLKSGPNNPSAGDPAGIVEVVEFSDFECPYCSRAAETLSGLKARYPEKVRFTFRHFPLSFHPRAKPAAEHAQCAHEQGLFWQYHDLVFANQKELGPDKLAEYAVQAGVDKGKFDECLASGRASAHVAADLAKGQEVGVGGTPSFYINGQAFAGNPTVDGIAAAIDAELAAAG